MNVQPYVRHSQTCQKKKDRYWKRCRCPKWLWVSGDGKQRRVSAKTRSWERAETIARDMLSGSKQVPQGRVQFAVAIKQYIRDKSAQNVSQPYLQHLEALLERQLLPWCQSEGILYIDQLTLPRVEAYRSTWGSVNYGRAWQQGKLKEFFKYCIKHQWAAENPFALLSPVRVRKIPTSYFPKEEMKRILAACPEVYPKAGYKTLTSEFLTNRLRAFVLLLRWSGLRIGDAVSLPRGRVSSDNKILLYMAKTGEPVFVPIPEHVADALRKIPGEHYFFWSGVGDLAGATKNWRKLLHSVFVKAKVKGHPHMFRDTFAVELLLAGVPIEQVSMLLGHSSVAITQKHYSPWVKARQVQLEDSVRKAWPNT